MLEIFLHHKMIRIVCEISIWVKTIAAAIQKKKKTVDLE